MLKKFGLYGLIQIVLPLLPAGGAAGFVVRLPLLPTFHTSWVGVLAWLALGNVIVIGLVTMAQRDLKQMIGNSSVMHMGYAFLGLATLSTLGTGGAVLLMVGHGLSVALLFLLSTSIHRRTQTFDLAEMGGLVRSAPVLAALFTAGTLAGIGLPGFANFWGELSIFVALWKFSPWCTAAALLGIIISAVYGLRAVARIFFGPPSTEFARVAAVRPTEDLGWGERLPALLLLAVLLFIGFWPRAVSAPLDQALQRQSPPAASAPAVANP